MSVGICRSQVSVSSKGGGSGSGTVTSVALTVPSRQSVGGSPITTAGTLAITDNVQNANLVFAGPATGAAAAPTFRALVTADLPSGTGTVTLVDGTGQQGAETASAAGAVATITATGLVRGTVKFISQTATGSLTVADSARGQFWIANNAGNVAYSLPAPAGNNFLNGWYLWVKNGSTTGTVTFTPPGGTTIDGLASIVLPTHMVVMIQSDGTNYHSVAISPVGNNAANLVMASPNGATGLPNLRALVGADIPSGAVPWGQIGNQVAVQSIAMTTTTSWTWGSGVASSALWFWDSAGNGTIGLNSPTTVAAVATSPTLTIQGAYQNAATPTFAADNWTISNIIGAGTNGLSTLTFAHSGTTGVARVSLPAQTANSGASLVWSGSNNTGIGVSVAGNIDCYGINSGASAPALNFKVFSGTSYTTGWSISCIQSAGAAVGMIIQCQATAAQPITLAGVAGTTVSAIGVILGGDGGNNGHDFTATSGTQWGVSIGGAATQGRVTFNPASGTCNFAGLMVNPTINTTGSYTGTVTSLACYPVLTSVTGATVRLLGLGTSSAVGPTGTLTDKFTVDTSGNVVAQGTYAAGANVGVSVGPITALTSITTTGGIVTALSGTSDARLKNYVGYQDGLEVINKIRPVKYQWNQKGHEITGLSIEQWFVGFIAQDIQKVIPEAITSKTAEGFLNVDDRPILAAAVNAIQSLYARVRALEQRLLES